MIQSPSSRRAYPPHLATVREGFTTWLKSVNEAWAPDGAVGDAPAQQAEEASAAHGGGRLQSGATVGIFALLVFYFLYFASPILIPIRRAGAPGAARQSTGTLYGCRHFDHVDARQCGRKR
jgi:hypothetical protein